MAHLKNGPGTWLEFSNEEKTMAKKYLIKYESTPAIRKMQIPPAPVPTLPQATCKIFSNPPSQDVNASPCRALFFT